MIVAALSIYVRTRGVGMPIQSGLSHAPVETQVRCSWRSAKYISSAIAVYPALPVQL